MINKSVIVVGAGGHAKVVIEILREMGERVDFCIGNHDSPEKCLDVTVIKGDEHLEKMRNMGYSRIFVAIGANDTRQRIAQNVTKLGFDLINAISPNSIISSSAKIGRGVAIMPGVVINSEATIGSLVIINTAASIDHDCKIGKAAHIGPSCGLAGNVSVGNNTFLGIGTKVIPQISIGKNVLVGAGSVVVKNITKNCLALGVPARIVKSLTKR
jgi:UDP-perosamine 4-acetyltransferase